MTIQRDAHRYVGVPIELLLDPDLEPMRSLLEGFVARRLRDAIGRRVWQLVSARASIRRHASTAITCRVEIILNNRDPFVGTTTTADLQTAIEASIQRVGQSVSARLDGIVPTRRSST